MKKKLLSMLLATVMVVSVCACGSNSSNEKITSNEGQSAISESSAKNETKPVETSTLEEETTKYPIVKEPITVKGVLVGIDTSKGFERIVWDKVSEITGINIEWEAIDAEALGTYLASGDLPDFIHSESVNQRIIDDYGVIGGKFVNYLDYLDYMPNLVQCFEDFPDVLVAATQSNGGMYNLPRVEVSATFRSVNPMVRTDVLDAAGIKIPTTIDEFYKALVTLKEKNGEPGFMLCTTDNSWFEMLFASFGTLNDPNYDDDGNGNVIFSRTTEQMKRCYMFLNKLYEEGLIHPEYLTMEVAARRQLAKEGKLAFIPSSDCAQLTADNFSDGKFHIDACVPFTSEYDSTQEVMGNVRYSPQGAFYMNAESEYITELCQMFDIMYATEEVVEGSGLSGQSFLYGIEGVDWYINDDGETYELVAPESYGGVFNVYQKEKLIFINAGRATALSGVTTSTESNGKYRQQAYVKNVIPYMADVFVPYATGLKFTEDEQYVLDNRITELEAYYKEMEAKFITGVVDIEAEWDNYCQTCEDMGINEVLEVYQASYERWNATIAEFNNKK